MKNIVIELALIVAPLAIALGFMFTQEDGVKQVIADAHAREEARATPHIVTSVDDCVVYKFENADGAHYFTRCSDAGVTTESTQPVSLAKNTDGRKTEVIVTNGSTK